MLYVYISLKFPASKKLFCATSKIIDLLILGVTISHSSCVQYIQIAQVHWVLYRSKISSWVSEIGEIGPARTIHRAELELKRLLPHQVKFCRSHDPCKRSPVERLETPNNNNNNIQM